MNEDRATRYQRQRRLVALLSIAITTAVLALFLATGLSAALRAFAESIGGPPDGSLWRFAIAVAVYGGVALVAEEVLDFPLAVYRGFLLERRYRVSRETFGVWLRDHLKAAVIGLVFGLISAEAVFLTIVLVGAWWWLVVAALAFLAAAFLTQILPTILLPMFYRLAPLERPALEERLKKLFDAHGVHAVGVYVWALGDKSTKANAALVGLGRTRRILLSDTLLAEYSDDEIEVVLAHELSHHVHHDLWKGIGFEALVALAGGFAADRALRMAGPAFGIPALSDLAGTPLLLLGAGAVSLVAMPLGHALSRHNERRADRFALALTGRAPAFISAMRRLAAQNLAEERPSALVRMLFYTHPPVEERVRAAQRFEGGES